MFLKLNQSLFSVVYSIELSNVIILFFEKTKEGRTVIAKKQQSKMQVGMFINEKMNTLMQIGNHKTDLKIRL